MYDIKTIEMVTKCRSFPQIRSSRKQCIWMLTVGLITRQQASATSRLIFHEECVQLKAMMYSIINLNGLTIIIIMHLHFPHSHNYAVAIFVVTYLCAPYH